MIYIKNRLQEGAMPKALIRAVKVVHTATIVYALALQDIEIIQNSVV